MAWPLYKDSVLRKDTMYELRDKKRKLKKQIRKKRREIFDLEEELFCVAKQHKTAKQIQQSKKYRSALLARARKGDLRITNKNILKILGEAA